MKTVKQILKEFNPLPTPYPTRIAGKDVTVMVSLEWDYTGMACVPAKPRLKSVKGLDGTDYTNQISGLERDNFAAEYWDWQMKEWEKEYC